MTEIIFSAIGTLVCGSEEVKYNELSDDTMRSLYSLSSAHDVSHLVSAELDAQGLLKIDDEISDKFRKQHMISIFRYEQMNYEFERICKTLEKNQISFVVLKGAVMRRYYPEPWMRTSSDIDFLINISDLEKIKSVLLEELSIEYKSSWHHEHSFFSESGVHIEFHDNLNPEDNRKKQVLENAWDYVKCVDGWDYMYEMLDEMFYFYHIAHMAKHFEEGGCGIRPFLDLWILDHCIEYDNVKRDDLLKFGGLLTFAKVARHLSEVWFGDVDHDNTTMRMEQYILRGGVYGTFENRVVMKQSKSGGKFKYILSRIFVPYDSLKFMYPILQKHSWLMPFMQVRRWLMILRPDVAKRAKMEMNINENMEKLKAEEMKT